MICGLLEPTQGEVRVAGCPTHRALCDGGGLTTSGVTERSQATSAKALSVSDGLLV